MSKIKELLIDVETKLIDGDSYDSIITWLSKEIGGDREMASRWIHEIEEFLCNELEEFQSHCIE